MNLILSTKLSVVFIDCYHLANKKYEESAKVKMIPALRQQIVRSLWSDLHIQGTSVEIIHVLIRGKINIPSILTFFKS